MYHVSSALKWAATAFAGGHSEHSPTHRPPLLSLSLSFSLSYRFCGLYCCASGTTLTSRDVLPCFPQRVSILTRTGNCRRNSVLQIPQQFNAVCCHFFLSCYCLLCWCEFFSIVFSAYKLTTDQL